MKIGIVGGGMMGLALGERLTRTGHDVAVFERAEQVGGLATWHDFGGFFWDRFYHVILPTDVHLTDYLREIGLADQLRWRNTLTGFYVDEHLYSVSSSLEFLKFPPLSLWSKFRLALTILYCARINDWRRLENVSVEDWLIRVSGKATYDKMWKPLLLAKLGESYRRVSAVFIWTYIKRLYSARDSSARKEQLGHVAGGYKTVFERLLGLIRSRGGRVNTGVTVRQARPGQSRGIELDIDGRIECFDKVIFTSPVNVLRQVAADELVSHERRGSDVEYLGVVCAVLVSKKPLVPYYVVNIADGRIPFTGVIGMSNVVSTEETTGFHLTYLPKYVLSDDAFLKRPDEEIRADVLAGLKTMFPDFDQECVVSLHINRAAKVQPLQVLNYSALVPQTSTRHPDFYVLNTAQFVNNTLNNNEVVGLVNRFFDDYGHHFEQPAREPVEELAAAGQSA